MPETGHPSTTIPLCIPTWDESKAFASGAKYSKDLGFYVQATDYLDPLHDWLPLRWKASPALHPEMLPVTAWQQNVRTVVSEEQWNRYRRFCYRAAGNRCEICGGQGSPHLECHERWAFVQTEGRYIQRLVGLIALCPLCHKAHHLGFAHKMGILPTVSRHICNINSWSEQQLALDISRVHAQWEARSQHTWELDLTWLQTSGYIHA